MFKILVLAMTIVESATPASTGLVSALQRLGLNSALVVRSQGVDEHPIWSPDGRFVAVDIDQNWMKIDLGAISLTKGTWHDGEGIGVPDPPPSPSAISEAQVREWEKSGAYAPRRIATKAGTVVELKPEGLGTLFRIARKGQKPTTLWTTSLEACHSLSLSPDQSLVAFVCELNGVVVTMLDP